MATTTNQLSWEAFEQLPDDESKRLELIEGDLQTLPPLTLGHCELSNRARQALLPIERRGGGRVFSLAGFKLSHEPPTWLRPDVSILRQRRIVATDPDDYFSGAPELAVEIIPPSESAADVQRKIDLFLVHGSLVVWVIYPRTQRGHVFLTDGTASIRGINDSLTLPGILPGFALPIATLFETE
jgi:Uma2 family endonuclease